MATITSPADHPSYHEDPQYALPDWETEWGHADDGVSKAVTAVANALEWLGILREAGGDAATEIADSLERKLHFALELDHILPAKPSDNRAWAKLDAADELYAACKLVLDREAICGQADPLGTVIDAVTAAVRKVDGGATPTNNQ